jgi:hypothetical protein
VLFPEPHGPITAVKVASRKVAVTPSRAVTPLEEPAYRRIAASLTAAIAAGHLPPGARVPSTRQIMAAHRPP